MVLGETFEAIFYQKKAVHQIFWWIYYLLDCWWKFWIDLRKKWCVNFLLDFWWNFWNDFRWEKSGASIFCSTFGETFETIFDEKKVVRQFFAGLLVKLLQRFLMRKKWCMNFLMDLPTYRILTEFLKRFSMSKFALSLACGESDKIISYFDFLCFTPDQDKKWEINSWKK